MGEAGCEGGGGGHGKKDNRRNKGKCEVLKSTQDKYVVLKSTQEPGEHDVEEGDADGEKEQAHSGQKTNPQGLV